MDTQSFASLTVMALSALTVGMTVGLPTACLLNKAFPSDRSLMALPGPLECNPH
jgi:hypothetical protein